MNDKKDKYEKSYEDLKKLNIAILNNKTKYVGKISEEDLKEIKEFSKDIKSENFQYNYSGGADIGQHSIHIWNYDLNEKIKTNNLKLYLNILAIIYSIYFKTMHIHIIASK